MFNGLRIGSSGMKTSQTVMDNVSDKISNSSTFGYKQKQVNFSELLINKIGENQVKLSEKAQNSGIDAGSKAVISKNDFNQGVITPSEGSFHMALEGKGFFGVLSEKDDLMLTRNGDFHRNADNSITDNSGNPLSMDIYIPKGQWPVGAEINISTEGLITTKDNHGNSLQLGKVIIYAPENNDELISFREGKYVQKQGLALYNSKDNPGREFALIRHRALEGSNVDMVQSMTDMIITQRSYQANAKSISTADNMLEVINTIL
jgi:flagellar basal-body rod protein FlgG